MVTGNRPEDGMASYRMLIKDARTPSAAREMDVYLNDPIWGNNTFKVYENNWTGAMFGTYEYYTKTKSIVFTATDHPGLVYPGEEINEEPYIWMVWDFLNYPNDCKAGARKSGMGEVYTNFRPDVANPIRWVST
jgi:hypothetical protein